MRTKRNATLLKPGTLLVTLSYGACLTPEQARNAYRSRQARFWIARIDEHDDIVEFLDIGVHPAYHPYVLMVIVLHMGATYSEPDTDDADSEGDSTSICGE